jgi:sialic acid synthase SpsE
MIELWAEAGPCDKSIDKALLYAEKAAEAGANALKVQWYNPDTIFSPNAPRYDKTTGPALTQNAAAANPIYPYHLWDPVISRCAELNLRFIPSVFDFEAIEAANHYELPILKIASGDLTYHQLIKAASDGRQLAVSTGGATIEEVHAAVDHLEANHILMACHLEYPTPFVRANIARTYHLQMEFPHLIPGFSDHTPGYDTIPLFVAAGVQVIEKHFTLVPFKGYDSDFALTPIELRNVVNKIEGTITVMGNAEVSPTPEEGPAIVGARRSPYAARDIPSGHVITDDDLVCLRPNYGISPSQLSTYIGRSFEVDIPKGGQLPT